MATDIAPALLANVQATLDSLIASDATLSAYQTMIDSGEDVANGYYYAQMYAQRLGELIVQALRSHISATTLPDGRMYYNIASRLLPPLLKQDYSLVTAVCARVQTALNAAAGLGLQAVQPALPDDRINGLVDEISNAERFDSYSRTLYDQIPTFSGHIVDASVEVNADVQARAGLSPQIVRIAAANCCAWCSRIAGTYDYEDARYNKSDIFKRHRCCRCVVSFKVRKLQQNVHTRRWYDESGTSISSTRIDLEPLRRTSEDAALLDAALAEEQKRIRRQQRAAAITAYADANGVSHRRAANRLTRAAQMTR